MLRSRLSRATALFAAIAASAIALFAPAIASAHEVYVLTPAQITQAIGMPPFDMIAVARDNLHQFTFWAFLSVFVVFLVFFISIIGTLERRLQPFFTKARRYAPLVARVTVGLSFLAAAYYQASYGPELPLINAYGPYVGIITAILIAIGIMMILGLYARTAAVIALAMFGYAVYRNGWYMLTYTNYLGEIIVLLALGAHGFSLDSLFARKKPAKAEHPATAQLTTPPQGAPSLWHRFTAWLAPKSFAILRICFGISLIYASAYAKIVYNNLALFTVSQYHLDKLLGFEPHFLVLGAAIIELVIGTFIILGFELRFTALFFEFWLVQSLLFFGEVVWPHIILIGIPIALVMYGYDRYSMEGYLFRKKKYEPVL